MGAGAMVLLAAVAAAPQGTVPLQVSLVPQGAAAERVPLKGVLHVVPAGGQGFAAAKAVDLPIEGQAVAPVQLPADLVWEVRTEAEGWWSKPVTVFVGATAAQAQVALWPDCTVTGRITVPEREKPPDSLTLRFRATAPATVKDGIVVVEEHEKEPFGEATCPVKAGRFECRIAAGTLDIKAKAKGFVPHYLWAKKLPERGTFDLAKMALRPGSSVSGFVTTAEGPADPKVCEVELSPLRGGPPPLAEMDRPSARIVKVRPDARGFFVFDGVAAGAYALEARQAEFAPLARAPIQVAKREDTELAPALVLERPVTLTIEVRPPTDGNGAAWDLHLFSLSVGEAMSMEEVFEAKASPEGRLERRGLAPGSYEVMLMDSQDNMFLVEDVEVSPGSQTLVLETKLVAVTGRVTLAGKPLVADVYFGGVHPGPTSTPMRSDEQGAFGGVISREGTWDVSVEAASPMVRSRLRNVDVKVSPSLGKAEVDLRVPDNKLTGRVVDDQQQPVAKARVDRLNPDAAQFVEATTGDDGTFELVALAPGHVAVSASDRTGDGPRRSEDVRVEIPDEGSAPSVKLVLARENDLEVHLVGESGEAVEGAAVMVWPDPSEYPTFGSGSVASDAAGVVKVTLPAGARRAAIMVLPQGYAFRALDVGVDRDKPVTVVLSRYGGALRLVFRPPLNRNDWIRVLGWEDGALVWGEILLTWAQMNGTSAGALTSQLAIPQVSSGNFTLCLVPTGGALAALAKKGGEKASCDDGFLPTLGELQLTLSAPK